MTYPDVKLKQSASGKYVLQTINGMQGRKDAGRSWYLLLRDIFHDFALYECPAEPALFSYYDGQESLVISTSTDDFLGATTSRALAQRFETHLRRFVEITVQKGSALKYLNVRIIQSELGISYDQTHHIRTSVLDVWFPPTTTERIKGADTPYRTDSQYEKELSEQLPASQKELMTLEKEYGGKYNALIGQFLHTSNKLQDLT